MRIPFSQRFSRKGAAAAALAAVWLAAGCQIKETPSFHRLDIGPMFDNSSFTPEVLSADPPVIAVRTAGADGDFTTRDDELVIVSGFDAAIQVARIPVPYLSVQAVSQPVAVASDVVVLGVATGSPQADTVSVTTAQDNTPYSVSINGATAGVTSGTGETKISIATQLAAALSALATVPAVTATDNGDGTITITAAQAPETFETAVSSNLSLDAFAPAFGDGDDALAVVSGLSGASPAVAVVQVGSLFEGPGAETSRPVAAGAASALVAVGGDTTCASGGPAPNCDFGDADDGVALVTGLGTATPLAAYTMIGYLSKTGSAVSRPVAVSGAAALITTAGVSGTYGAGSDRICVIDLAGPSSACALNVGTLNDSEASRPVFLASTPSVRALVSNGGANAFGDASDRVALLYDLDGAPAIEQILCPVIGTGARGQARVLAAGLAVVPGGGPNTEWGSSDDLVNVLGGLDAANPAGTPPTRTALPVKYLSQAAAPRPLAFSANQAVVPAAGEDGVFGTSDDVLVLLDALDTAAPASADWNVGLSLSQQATRPQLFPPNTGPGPDPTKIFIQGAEGETFALVDPLGAATLAAAYVPDLGFTGIAPFPLLHDLVLGVGPGADGAWKTADDGLLLIHF